MTLPPATPVDYRAKTVYGPVTGSLAGWRRRVLRVGRLIVIEGLDGSGKRTLTDALSARWRADGRSVATMAFPRYGVDVHADLVRDALYGRLGDLSDSVYGPALLFALDRRAAADRRSGICWPPTTSCCSTATSRRTPPTARPGWAARPSPPGSPSGCASWRSTGSASRCRTGRSCWPPRSRLPRSGPATARGRRDGPGVGQLRGGRRAAAAHRRQMYAQLAAQDYCRRGRC